MKTFTTTKREQFIVDRRTDEERMQIRHNLPSKTLEPYADVYQDRAQLVSQKLSVSLWFPSIYQLTEQNQVLLIHGSPSATSKNRSVDFTFYNNARPWKEVQIINVAKGDRETARRNGKRCSVGRKRFSEEYWITYPWLVE